MSTSLRHDLTLRDPADGTLCPMERLADRFIDAPKPKWLKVHAARYFTGCVQFELSGQLTSPDQIEDLINYLARVK